MATDGDNAMEPPRKRFKHQSYKSAIREVHLPSAVQSTQLDEDLAENETHFKNALDVAAQLNLSPTFVKFIYATQHQAASIPLLLLHADDVVERWRVAVGQDEKEDEGLAVLVELLPALLQDLRTTLKPKFNELVDTLTSIIPRPQLSPRALTAVLSALASVFRLLQPDDAMLRHAHKALLTALRKCSPEVQSAAAEVWGAVLRRAKGPARDAVVDITLADGDSVAEFVAAHAFVAACKNVSQSLHTSAPPLVALLLSHSADSHVERLTRRVLTSLSHFCAAPTIKDGVQVTPSGFSPVADVLVANNLASLPVIAHAASVRKGARFSKDQIAALASQLVAQPIDNERAHDQLKLAAALLVAGDMTSWSSVARPLVEWSWSGAPSVALELCGAVTALGWNGWSAIGLPAFTKRVPPLFGADADADTARLATRVLAELCTQARAPAADDAAFWDAVRAHVDRRLDGWVLSEDNVAELTAMLKLTPVLARVEAKLDLIIDRLLAGAASPQAGWVLGRCFDALSHTKEPDIDKWTPRVLERWTADEHAMTGFVALVQASSASVTLPLETALPAVRSHKRALRLAALRLSAPDANAAVRHMLAAEECTLDVAGSRGRTVRITKLPALLGTVENAKLGIAWLLGQLKVNLRPVWDPAGKALAELAARWGEEVWDAVWAELDRDEDMDVDSRPADDDEEEEDDGVVKEAERTWRCPAAANVQRAVWRWRADGSSARREVLKARRPTDRLDGTNYTTQLLRTLALVPALAEKHSRLLVPRFLALSEANMKGKLGPYLALFATFSNPKALYRTGELHAVYLALLAHPDRAVQRDALACVQAYRAPAVVRLADSLRGLLDETKWRDEMVALTGAAGDAPLEADAEGVLVRVCYGLMTERRAGKERRAAALTLVGALGERAMGVLVDLMLGPFDAEKGEDGLPGEKQQLGFLAMLADVLSSLGTSTMAYWPRLLDATLACLGAAQRKLDITTTEEHDENEDTKDGGTRAVRLAGLKRFAEFFRVPSAFDFAPHVARAFACAISPRLPAFERENTQAPSALLQMFAAWAGGAHTVRFLVDCDGAVLPKTFALLAAPSVKPPVVARVLDVADRVLALSDEDPAIAEAVLLPHVGALLENLAVLVARSTAAAKGALGDLAQRQISILSRVAGHVREPTQAAALLALFEPLLRRPPRVVSEKVKADLLKIYVELIPRVPELTDASSARYAKTYELLSGLFSMLRMRAARTAAAAAFAKLCGDQDKVATLVGEMNAFSVKRIEEPDFERRFNAFKLLNDEMHARLSARAWLPVLHNLLFFVQDTDELSLRNNAAYGLRRFVDRVAADEAGGDIVLIFSRVVYPAIKRALRSAAELVRAEVLGVLAHGVEKCDNMPSLVEMRGLLAGGDEEANFFNNIAHIQVHRRSRAMRRLVEYIDTGAVCSATLSQVFVPLVSHPIYNSGTTDHLLVNEAITTTGAIAKHLNWPAYFSLVQQYLRGIKEPKEKVPVKPLVRALVSILDNFHFPMDASAAAGAADGPVATEDAGDDDEPQPVEPWKADSRIMDAVTAKLLPSLLNILENREETEDGLRIPVCVGIVRIALHLPEQQRQPQVSRLLTVMSQIFRSKSQDTRDLTRETLCKIIVMLGPDYLAEAMKQLRGALLRGPHLHILAFVTHSILVHITSNASEQFATIDDSVADIAHVAAEVIFGQSGKDVQSEDFKTKLKEVKGSTSRGLDCFALVSKCISSAKLSTLLLPVRNIMEETESAKVMLQVDDVLRRVASGLNANPQLKPTDLLVMCHTLISQNARFLRETSTPSKKQGKIHPDVAVQVKRTLDAPTNHYINNSHRFIALGLDVFVTAARRSKFDLHDPDTISRLEPMVNVIGNTLYSSNANVLTLGLKAAAAIIKYPLKNVNKSMPVLTRQMFDVVKQAGSTESEVAQTALKTLAVLLRDAKSESFKVKEADLTFLLDILGPDLEEHERQATVFAVLRAIIARKLMVPEIYDMMDRVAQVMVTNQSPQVQELCRGVLLQFYLDYPQGKGRLQKQMNFLAKNLSYVFESGRKSVMELLSAVFAKYDPAKLTEFSNLFFVALVMVMANDDSPTCREMAAELIKVLLQILEDSQRAELMALLQSWAGQATKPQLVRVSVQLLGVVVDTLQNDASSYIPMISGILRTHTEEQARILAEVELESDEPRDLDWQLPYQLLTVLAKVLRTFPALTLSPDTVPWRSVVALLLFPHAWVRTGAARLLGMLYGAQPPQQPSTQLAEDHPLSASGMAEVARKSCLQLRGDTLDAQLSVQVTKNLVYVGKCYCLSTSPVDAGDAPNDDGDSDDEADGAEDAGAATKPAGQLNWLFSRLSHQARSAVVARRNRSSAADNWTEQPASILKFFAAMANHMQPAETTKFLLHILAPIQRVLDEDTLADAPMDALKALASEVQDLVQKKVGTTAFTEVYSGLRNRALNVRRERKEARTLLVATDPQRAARRKQQHEAVKKESRKRKNREFKEGRSGKVKKLRND